MNTRWIGINLKNPIMLASLTLISHKRIEEHIKYYEKVAQSGVGAVIMESVVPIAYGKSDVSYTQNDLLPIESGLREKQFMGFSLMGPPYPNVISIKYGIPLIEGVCKRIHETPVIGSIIANFGEEQDVVDAAICMANLGVRGLELNFSCPNILTLNKTKERQNITYRNSPSLNILKAIKNTGLGISLKLPPGYDLSSLDGDIFTYIDGITYSNAYIGLVPPKLEPPFASSFGRGYEWAYSGVYGPFERLLTYGDLVKIKKNPLYKHLKLSIVGGIVEEKHVVEALLLGAMTVQLSSAIFWKGFKFAKSAIRFLEQFMEKNGFNSIEAFRGSSLRHICSNVSDIENYKHPNDGRPQNQLPQMKVITSKCLGCFKCLDISCIALHKKDGKVAINGELCSGCGWCNTVCPAEAIKRDDNHN